MADTRVGPVLGMRFIPKGHHYAHPHAATPMPHSEPWLRGDHTGTEEATTPVGVEEVGIPTNHRPLNGEHWVGPEVRHEGRHKGHVRDNIIGLLLGHLVHRP